MEKSRQSTENPQTGPLQRKLGEHQLKRYAQPPTTIGQFPGLRPTTLNPADDAFTGRRLRLLEVQRSVGNQALNYMTRANRSPGATWRQPTLKVNSPGDEYEREADDVAEHVMRMPAPQVAGRKEFITGPTSLQRECSCAGSTTKCSACEDEQEHLMHRSSSTAAPSAYAPPIVSEALRSSGAPLDSAVRAFMEPRFARDFSQVRIHSDAKAAESARSVNALAYTVGRDIVFAGGQYAPASTAGKRLLAHELAHTIQQMGPQRLAPMGRNPGAPLVSSGPVALSRATVKVGGVSAQVNYGDLINIPVTGYITAIQSRFHSYTGTSLSPAVVAQITAFTPRQQEWALFALDILSENTAQAPGLNRTKAFQRLVDRAPHSSTRGLGTSSFAFEREVLVTSGWAEEAISGRLSAPTPTDLGVIDPLLNPPPSSTAPPGGVFDAATFKAELPVLTRAYLTHSSSNPANWPGRRAQPLADVQALGNVIQAQARTFFAPFAGTARNNRWLTDWQYATKISSVTTDPGGSPRTISRNERLALIRNRATRVGSDNSSGPSLFSRTNFDHDRDAAALDKVVADLEADPVVQPLVDELLRHTAHTDRQNFEVRMETEVSTADPECDTRWETIRTLCHELMHALAHPDFFAAVSSSPRFPHGVNLSQVLVEGFAEVLGVQLFTFLRTAAASDAGLLSQLTQHVTGPCKPPTTQITLRYGSSGANAKSILDQVGNDRFRAAYFHGRVTLIGL